MHLVDSCLHVQTVPSIGRTQDKRTSPGSNQLTVVHLCFLSSLAPTGERESFKDTEKEISLLLSSLSVQILMHIQIQGRTWLDETG